MAGEDIWVAVLGLAGEDIWVTVLGLAGEDISVAVSGLWGGCQCWGQWVQMLVFQFQDQPVRIFGWHVPGWRLRTFWQQF